MTSNIKNTNSIDELTKYLIEKIERAFEQDDGSVQALVYRHILIEKLMNHLRK